MAGGCAAVLPNEYTIGERQILEALAGAFPAQRRVLEIFDLRMSAPKLKLLPQENRLMIGFDLGVAQVLLGRGQEMRGQLMFSSGLRWEPADATVRLDRVRREHLAFEGLPAPLASSVNRWGGWLAAELLEGREVHRVERGTLERLGWVGLKPSSLKVTPSGIAVGFDASRGG
ncbi:MAG: hypothetical protein RL456_3166 [Pseudomonadota bacterium]|jgi:hypothetical protein